MKTIIRGASKAVLALVISSFLILILELTIQMIYVSVKNEKIPARVCEICH